MKKAREKKYAGSQVSKMFLDRGELDASKEGDDEIKRKGFFWFVLP